MKVRLIMDFFYTEIAPGTYEYGVYKPDWSNGKIDTKVILGTTTNTLDLQTEAEKYDKFWKSNPIFSTTKKCELTSHQHHINADSSQRSVANGTQSTTTDQATHIREQKTDPDQPGERIVTGYDPASVLKGVQIAESVIGRYPSRDKSLIRAILFDLKQEILNNPLINPNRLETDFGAATEVNKENIVNQQRSDEVLPSRDVQRSSPAPQTYGLIGDLRSSLTKSAKLIEAASNVGLKETDLFPELPVDTSKIALDLSSCPDMTGHNSHPNLDIILPRETDEQEVVDQQIRTQMATLDIEQLISPFIGP